MLIEKVKKCLAKVKRENKGINAILQINPHLLEEAEKIEKKKEKGKLYGKIIAVKANINVKGLNASCASRTLEDYKCPYDASVIEKIKEEDGLILGMCNMDEFACGGSGETSAFGVCGNPAARNVIPGGSSSGSAASVAAGFCDIALGSDTGGSIRNPASNCGVVGIKPTYGLVSRYGLIDLSMSLDQIGTIAKNVEDALLLLNVIKGKDEKDATSYDGKEIKILKLKNLKIGVPEIKADSRIKNLVLEKTKEIMKKNKWKIEKINLPHMDLGVQTYYPINYAEFFSGTRKFDGRKYGKKIEGSCGEEVLRRIFGGQEISQVEYHGQYYRKALQAKSLIKGEFEKAFEKVDVIVMPVLPYLPWNIGEKISVEEVYKADALTVLANLAELPAMSIPVGEIEGIPIGLQIIAPRFREDVMFSVAEQFEK